MFGQCSISMLLESEQLPLKKHACIKFSFKKIDLDIKFRYLDI